MRRNDSMAFVWAARVLLVLTIVLFGHYAMLAQPASYGCTTDSECEGVQ